MYNKVDEKFIAGLQAIVGKEHVYADPDTLDQYKTDEETDPAKFHTPEAVVAPGSTEEVAAVVKLANEANIPVTVRSAGTSLADGAIAVCGGIILLMGRMNRILEVNTEGLYLVAEAGALVKECQAAAKKHQAHPKLQSPPQQLRRQKAVRTKLRRQARIMKQSLTPAVPNLRPRSQAVRAAPE